MRFDYLRNADTVQHALRLGYPRPVRPRLVPHHAEGSSREKAVDEPQPREGGAESLDVCSTREVRGGLRQVREDRECVNVPETCRLCHHIIFTLIP